MSTAATAALANGRSGEVATQDKSKAASAIERAVVQGDLSHLTPDERTKFYLRVCESVGLNPMTKPFEYITLPDRDRGKDAVKTILYATKNCAEQLRNLKKVSIEIVRRERIDGCYIVTARATMPDGRRDEADGVVPIEKEGGEWKQAKNSDKRYFEPNGRMIQIRGDALANALMKAETKAKRRVALSICGLGMMDESELDTVRTADVQIEPSYPTPPAVNASEPAALPPATGDRPAKFDEYVAKLSACESKTDFVKVMGEIGGEVATWAKGPKDEIRAISNRVLDLVNAAANQPAAAKAPAPASTTPTGSPDFRISFIAELKKLNLDWPKVMDRYGATLFLQPNLPDLSPEDADEVLRLARADAEG